MIETGNLKLVACTRMHLQGMQRTEMPSMMGADTVEGWLVAGGELGYGVGHIKVAGILSQTACHPL